jgi:hypothetical protein
LGGRGGETADAVDSKSTVGNHVRVQIPPSAPRNLRLLIDRLPGQVFRPCLLKSSGEILWRHCFVEGGQRAWSLPRPLDGKSLPIAAQRASDTLVKMSEVAVGLLVN